MANTPEIDVSQGSVLTVLRASTSGIYMPQGRVSAVINFPTADMRVSQAQVRIIANASNTMLASQATVLAVARGRVDNFSLRAWWFSMDGHDFYVLQLGMEGTLVFDLTSQQWVEWRSSYDNFDPEVVNNWRATTGAGWNSIFGKDHNSDVIAGDDTFGLVWYLDPLQSYDDSANGDEVQKKFLRVLTGGVPMRTRATQPVNLAYITGSLGYPVVGSQINLETSDDSGKSWDDHGYITVNSADFSQELSWPSLGLIVAPGRIFRITDTGAVARIDGLDII